MPMRIQAVTYRCRHRGIVHHAGTEAEGRRLARLLAVERCRKCDPNASPVIWFDRIAMDAAFSREVSDEQRQKVRSFLDEWSGLSIG